MRITACSRPSCVVQSLALPAFDERTATAQAVFDGNVNRIAAGAARHAFAPV